ncbi:unnamed protein product [[Candida] boidinii]|nr:unnamed protein product [[Candida] boidinii]
MMEMKKKNLDSEEIKDVDEASHKIESVRNTRKRSYSDKNSHQAHSDDESEVKHDTRSRSTRSQTKKDSSTKQDVKEEVSDEEKNEADEGIDSKEDENGDEDAKKSEIVEIEDAEDKTESKAIEEVKSEEEVENEEQGEEKEEEVEEQEEAEEAKEEQDEEEVKHKSKRQRTGTEVSGHKNKRFQILATQLITQISSNRFASMFLQPVNKSDEPLYYKIINSPQDLKTIQREVKQGKITTFGELEFRLQLMFSNAVMYNDIKADTYKLTIEMMEEAKNIIELFRDSIST